MLDFKIFVTGKYGKKNRTNDISDISYDKEKNIYNITYKGGDTSYTYRSKDVQIVKNCLNDKQSATVFDYLLQMAQFTDIKNDNENNNTIDSGNKWIRFDSDGEQHITVAHYTQTPQDTPAYYNNDIKTLSILK